MRLHHKAWLAVAAALLVAGASFPRVTSAAPVVPAHRFAVATECRAATDAAMATLQAGGHAADAAIAAALVQGVVNPTSSGVGGGGFALIWDRRAGRMVALDFRELAPRGIEPASLDKRPVDDAKRGVMVGVPGEVAGLAELHRRWGRRTFAQDAAAAIAAADRGFAIERHLARVLDEQRRNLSVSPAIQALFFRSAQPLGAGQRVRNPLLASTLRGIARRGPSAFYSGAVAADIAAAVQLHGGSMDETDLGAYRVVERKPIGLSWGTDVVFTMPPPSAGGLLVAQMMLMHPKASLASMGDGSPNLIHALAETFRGSIADRVRAVGDPAFVPDPIEQLLSAEHLEARRRRIGWDRTHIPQRFELPEHGTSHMVVVDAQGNVVSLTTTVNRAFGARIVAPASGVVLNDELDDFTPPSAMAAFGVAGGGPNAPRAGARPVSSMSPTIVMREGKPLLALGGSGGMRIAPNVAQVAARVLAFGMTVEQAVAAPRFMVGVGAPDLLLESGWLSDAQVRDLRDRGERAKASDFPAAVQAVMLQQGPRADRMQAASDPRKFGYAEVR